MHAGIGLQLSQCKNSWICCVLASHNKLQWNEPSIISGQIWLVDAGWSRRTRPSHNIPGHNDTFWWPFIKSVWLHTKLYHHAGNVKWKLSPHSQLSAECPLPSLHTLSAHHSGPTKMSHCDTSLTDWLTVCLSGFLRTRVNPSKS